MYMFVCAHVHAYILKSGSTQDLHRLVLSNNYKWRDYNSIVKIQFKHRVCCYHIPFYKYINTFYRKDVSYIKYWQPYNVLNMYLFNILLRLFRKIILDTLYFHKVYAIMMSNLHVGSNSLIHTPSTLMGFRSSMWERYNKHCFRR